MTPAAILDDRKSLSIVFLSFSNQYATFIFLNFVSQNGCRRPFWMTENNFRSYFSPFQINTQFCFHKMAAQPFWMMLHHFSPFQINTQFFFQIFFPNFFFQNGRRRPFWKSDLDHFHFWMTENHFLSHFSPSHINTQSFLIFFQNVSCKFDLRQRQ